MTGISVLPKQLEIQQKLNAPKNNYNSFGRYAYRSCEDITEAAKPILAETKTVLVMSDSIEMIGDRVYVKATATLIDTETGDSVSNTAYAREPMEKKGADESQITGAASSYARKYALNGLFCIDDVKDADEITNTEPKPKSQSKKKAQAPAQPEIPEQPAVNAVTADQLKELLNRASVEKVDVKKICELYKVVSLNMLSPKQYEHAMANWAIVKQRCI